MFREYERGLVALLAGPAAGDAEVTLRAPVEALLDLFSGRRLRVGGQKAELRPEPRRCRWTGSLQPIGRVYLKLHQRDLALPPAGR